MAASLVAEQTNGSAALRAIGWSGFVAGTLDICSAFVVFGMRGASPTQVLQGVASGLLGRSSFQGGTTTAALGLALHFFIAYGAAVVFYIASRKLRTLTTRPVASGLAYGLVVYVVMTCVVLPLSAATPRHSVASVVTQIVIHMALIGLPISLITRRFSGNAAIAR